MGKSNKRTHPLKEIEILLSAAAYHMDSGEDGGTDEALDCAREANDLMQEYLYEELCFSLNGTPPKELVAAEKAILRRVNNVEKNEENSSI